MVVNLVPTDPNRVTDLVYENTASKSFQLCCITVFFYYVILHLEEEVEFIWAKKWTLGKAIYIVTRYTGAIFLIFVAGSVYPLLWNDKDFLMTDARYKLNKYACLKGWIYIGPGSAVFILAEVILQMRVYALYERSRKILVLLVLLFSITITAEVLLFTGHLYKLLKDRCLGQLCYLTFDVPLWRTRWLILTTPVYCSVMSYPLAPINWLVTSTVDFILFIMVYIKSREGREWRVKKEERKKDPWQPKDISAVMARDSTVYFAAVFSICAVGTVHSFLSQYLFSIAKNAYSSFIILVIGNLLSTYETIAVTLMAILAPRMLVNIRSEFYAQTKPMEKTISWNVAEVAASSTTSERDASGSHA